MCVHLPVNLFLTVCANNVCLSAGFTVITGKVGALVGGSSFINKASTTELPELIKVNQPLN